MKIFQLLFISSLYLIIKTAVIGIDFGSEYFKVSMIAPGKPFVIIENTASKRKTHTAVAFTGNNRQYESNAITKRLKFPKNTFLFVQKFLGTTSEEVKQISEKYFEYYNIIQDEQRNAYQFQLDNVKLDEEDEQDVILKVEDIIAMILRSAKSLAEKQGGVQIKDCVVTIPASWTLQHRQSLDQAVQIAGMNLLGTIKENSAAALYFGLGMYINIINLLERNDENQTVNVLFYNMGSYFAQASIVQYTTVNSTEKGKKSKQVETVTVLSDFAIEDNGKKQKVCLNNQGGLALDLVLANYFAEQFDSQQSRQGKPSLKTYRRAMVKLMNECNNLKEKLSANKDAMISVEGLLDAQDFHGKITRVQFEELSQNVFERSMIPVKEAIQRSGLSLEDINQVEILGGGIRVPKIQQLLAEQLPGVEIGAHMNGDESMAQGAAFYAANLSKSFRVRQVNFNDGYNFGVNLTLKTLDEQISQDDQQYYFKEITLFQPRKSFGFKKVVTLSQFQDLKAEIIIFDNEGLNQKIYSYNLTDINSIYNNSKYNESMKPKLHLEFEIDSIDGPLLNDAFFALNYSEPQEYYDYVVVNSTDDIGSKQDGENTNLEDKNDKQKQEQDKDGEEVNKQDKKDGESDSENKSNHPRHLKIKTKIENPPKKEKVKKIRYKFKTKNVPVTISEQSYIMTPLNKTSLKKSARLLKRFDTFEENVKKIAEIKNRLESLVYSIQDQFGNKNFIKASTEEERYNIQKKNDEEKEWIDSDDSSSANFTYLRQRFENLQSTLKPIFDRLEEAKSRPDAINKTIDMLDQFAKKTKKLRKTMSWVPKEKIQKLSQKIIDTKEWVKEKMEAQSQLKLNQDPIFKVEELNPKLDKISKEYTTLKNIKKPKPPKNSTSTGNETVNNQINLDGELPPSMKGFDRKAFRKFQQEYEEKNRNQKKDGESQYVRSKENEQKQELNEDL